MSRCHGSRGPSISRLERFYRDSVTCDTNFGIPSPSAICSNFKIPTDIFRILVDTIRVFGSFSHIPVIIFWILVDTFLENRCEKHARNFKFRPRSPLCRSRSKRVFSSKIGWNFRCEKQKHACEKHNFFFKADIFDVRNKSMHVRNRDFYFWQILL